MTRHLILIAISLVFFSVSLSADTIVTIKNEKGQKTSFMSDGKQGRMDTGDGDSYMIINYANQSIQVVMPSKSQVLDMSDGMPGMGMNVGKPPEKIRMKIKAVGIGPKIAGYPTKTYRLSAKGENCGTLYTSKAAMNDSGMKKMFSAMRNMAEKSRQSMGALAGMMTKCQQAKLSMADTANVIGAPLRTIDKQGRVLSEVMSINKKAKLPAGTFTIPANYKVVSMADKMSEGQAARSKAMGGMPDMGKMMQQMQKSGRMTPEMIEQMKQMQEMYQQKY